MIRAARSDVVLDSAGDTLSLVVQPEVIEQERDREDRSRGVGLLLPRDVGRRTMNGLEHRRERAIRELKGLERALLGLAARGELCAKQEVALVGGGNSAGQATVYLASQAAKVWLLVRGPDLKATMSRYLIDRIASLPNVEV